MADWVQDDWRDNQGPPRNALRCMERGENSAAGAQWLALRDNKGDHPKRSPDCGVMDDPNTDYKFKIEWNQDNADKGKMPYCQDTIPEEPIDNQEFVMTDFNPPNGALHFPFDHSKGNQYSAVTVPSSDHISQCRAEVVHQTNTDYSATYYDWHNEEVASGSKTLDNDGDRLVLKRETEGVIITSLAVIRTGEMGDSGAGSKIRFESFLTEGENNPLTDFAWDTESTGLDKRCSEARLEGGYYKVPNIEKPESGPKQQITCYYPCALG